MKKQKYTFCPGQMLKNASQILVRSIYKLKRNSLFSEVSFWIGLPHCIFDHMNQLTSYKRWQWCFPILLSESPINHQSFEDFTSMILLTFSRGFILGLCGGHFITAIPSSLRKLNTVLVLWQGALSCINFGVSTALLRKWGRACWRRNSL